MTQIISFHSFRRGNGKSMLTANVALLAAAAGLRTAVVEQHFTAPSCHYWLPPPLAVENRLNLLDFFYQDTPLPAIGTPYPTPQLSGTITLFQAPDNLAALSNAANKIIDLARLHEALIEISGAFDLILLDNGAGIGDHALASFAFADLALFVLRPNSHEIRSTLLLLDIAAALELPEAKLIINECTRAYNPAQIATSISTLLDAPVLGTLPLDETVAASAPNPILLTEPDQPFALQLAKIGAQLFKA